MKPLLILAALLIGLPAFGQSTWRNWYTTNQNPIIDIVAGSNTTVQASVVPPNLRRWTVNSIPSGGAQTNISWTGVTNLQSAQVPYSIITNPPTISPQTNISWIAVTNLQSSQVPYTVITNLTSAQLPQSAITNQTPRSFGFGFDGGGAAIQAGTRGLVAIPFTGTITSSTLMAYPSGSIELRLWRTNSADASFPPTAAGSIGTNVLTTDNYAIDSTLTGWTTLVSSGDVFTVSIPTNALSITNLTWIVKVQP